LFFPLNNYKKYIDDHKSFLFALIVYSKLIKGYFMVKDGFTKNLLMFLGYFQVKKKFKIGFLKSKNLNLNFFLSLEVT
jgi:hypothetical protein